MRERNIPLIYPTHEAAPILELESLGIAVLNRDYTTPPSSPTYHIDIPTTIIHDERSQFAMTSTPLKPNYTPPQHTRDNHTPNPQPYKVRNIMLQGTKRGTIITWTLLEVYCAPMQHALAVY